MDADDVYRTLREILDDKLQDIYDKMDKDKKEIVDIMSCCQRSRDKFHAEMIPQYDRVVCKEKRRSRLQDKIIAGVLVSLAGMLLMGGVKLLVTLQALVDLVGK